jgi:hypothetical protein
MRRRRRRDAIMEDGNGVEYCIPHRSNATALG